MKPAGHGISEMRIDYGPGYRVYFMQGDALVIVLLCGGDKGTQSADIKRALVIASDWKALQPQPVASKRRNDQSGRKGRRTRQSSAKPRGKRK